MTDSGSATDPHGSKLRGIDPVEIKHRLFYVKLTQP